MLQPFGTLGFPQNEMQNIWHVNCSAPRMRLLCHLLCLGLNLAYGTCVAAAPAKSQSVTSLSLASTMHPVAGQIIARSGAGLPGKASLSYISVGKPVTKPGEIDSGLHRIRFVDRYWPAKMGYEPPVRISSLCLNTADSRIDNLAGAPPIIS